MTDARSSETRMEPATVETSTGDQAALESNDIFVAAARLAAVPMILTNQRRPDNPIVFANPAFCAMTGYRADEVVGRNCRFLQGPETDPATVRALGEAIAAKREFAAEILNYRKDGSAFWNALSVAPIPDASGEPAYFMGSQVDVTRRYHAEDALQRALAADALRRPPGGFTHDLNNLLQVIVGYLDLMKAGLGKSQVDFDRLTRGLDNARAAADRATTLTQQFLTLSRTQRRIAPDEAASRAVLRGEDVVTRER